MSIVRRAGRASFVCGAFAAVVLGVTALFAPRAHAIPPNPILLCGPTILWECSDPGGPDVLFAGTICQRARLERRTGLTCAPFSGW